MKNSFFAADNSRRLFFPSLAPFTSFTLDESEHFFFNGYESACWFFLLFAFWSEAELVLGITKADKLDEILGFCFVSSRKYLSNGSHCSMNLPRALPKDSHLVQTCFSIFLLSLEHRCWNCFKFFFLDKKIHPPTAGQYSKVRQLQLSLPLN